LDEEQHLDYIIKVSETGKPPIVGKDFLDERIIKSVLETKRHSKFHWPTPEFSHDENMTLEGYSYEGFQGPLFYYLFTPIFLLLPGNILDKLFIIRILLVLLSTITIFIAYKICIQVLNFDEKTSLLIGFVIVCLPERAFSNSRVSNDTLLEVISILSIYLLTYTILHGMSWRNSIILGLIGGLGLITKIAFAGIFVAYPIAFIINSKDKKIFKKALLSGSLIAIISIPYFLYNFNLYKDVTGYNGFVTLYENFAAIWTPDFNGTSFISSLFIAFKHFWIIWWEGSIASSNLFLKYLWLYLGLLSLFSLIGLVKFFREYNFKNSYKFGWVIISYVLIVLTFIFLLILGYFQGKYPEIQGRFINPALFPILFLFCFGLTKYKLHYSLIFLTSLLLLLSDFLFLFGHLLPFHYYFSQFFINGEAIPIIWEGWKTAFIQFTKYFIEDKPGWTIIIFLTSLFSYIFIMMVFLPRFLLKKFMKPQKVNP